MNLERVEIHLYRNCNLKCQMCDFKDYMDEVPLLEKMYIVIDQLSEMNVKIVHFTGGEVLLYPYLDELFSYVVKHNMKVHMTSNGLLLNNDSKRHAVAKYAAKVQISIDHHNAAIHNELRGVNKTLENVLSGIKKLKIENPNISLTMNTVISKYNADEIMNMIKLCGEYGFSVFNPIPIKGCEEMLPSAVQINDLIVNEEKIRSFAAENNVEISTPNFHIFNVKTDKEAYNRILYREGCKLLNNQMFINMTTGEVLPCPMTMYRNKASVLCGNIYEESLSSIWNSECITKVRRLMRNTKCSIGKICYEFCDPAFCYNQTQLSRK